MKTLMTVITAIAAITNLLSVGVAVAQTPQSPALKYTGRNALNDPDIFLPVTPDRLLGRSTRDQWLAMSEVNARIYWEAWNCNGLPCDTELRARIRATSRLIPRTKENFGLRYKPEG